jgi:hypothetical protein
VDELLEVLGVRQLGEDAEHLVVRERRAVAARLHLVLEPLARFDVLDVTKLDADGAPVRLAQVGDDRPQRGVGRHPGDAHGGERLVELRGRQIEPVQVELVARLGGRAERIEVRVHVPARAVCVDELEDPALERGGVEEILARHGRGRRRRSLDRDGPVGGAVRAGIGAIDLGEERSPLLVDRLRALKIAGVKLFYDAGVDTELLEHLVDPWVMALPRQKRRRRQQRGRTTIDKNPIDFERSFCSATRRRAEPGGARGKRKDTYIRVVTLEAERVSHFLREFEQRLGLAERLRCSTCGASGRATRGCPPRDRARPP